MKATSKPAKNKLGKNSVRVSRAFSQQSDFKTGGTENHSSVSAQWVSDS